MDNKNTDCQKVDSSKVYDDWGPYKQLIRDKQANIAQLIEKGGVLYFDLDLLDAIDLYLIPFIIDSKYGFINKKAEIVTEPIYDKVQGSFLTEENYVAVKKDGKWSAINSKGKELLPFDYSHIFTSPDSSLAICDKSGKSVIDLNTLNVVVERGTYDIIDTFRYGYARVKKNEKYGIINAQGKLVLDTKI